MQYAYTYVGCGSLAVARADNLYVLWGLLVLGGLGIGGIVVPASIITIIICPDVSRIILLPSRYILTWYLGLDCNNWSAHLGHSSHWR